MKQPQTTTAPQLAPLPPEDWPDISHIVTEDDAPVDNVFSEKQQRLLTEPLYASWPGPGEGRPFVAYANVGLFYGLHLPPLVPDMLLSLDVSVPDEVWTKVHRSYFVWVYGKPPDVVVEVVSNKEGGEADRKVALYASIGIPYYAIYDPERHLGPDVLRILRLVEGEYRLSTSRYLPRVGLSLRLWNGEYEGLRETWLRWHDLRGRLILTGAERAKQAQREAEHAQREAEQAQHEAEHAQREAEHERERAARLAAQLRAMGVEPEA